MCVVGVSNRVLGRVCVCVCRLDTLGSLPTLKVVNQTLGSASRSGRALAAYPQLSRPIILS